MNIKTRIGLRLFAALSLLGFAAALSEHYITVGKVGSLRSALLCALGLICLPFGRRNTSFRRTSSRLMLETP